MLREKFMILLRCATDFLLYVLAAPDKRGILRSIRSHPHLLGEVLAVDCHRSISEQLSEHTQHIFKTTISASDIYFYDSFAPQISLPQIFAPQNHFLPKQDIFSVTMYVAKITKNMEVDPHIWHTYPQFLSQLPSCDYRKYYLQSWQVLMGGMKQDCKVMVQKNPSAKG